MQTQALKEILEKSPIETVGVENGGCPHFNICGGCSYISMPYEESLKIKENQVRELLEPVLSKQQSVCQIEPIRQSPVYYGYRNKMEFTFGDEVKDGPLALGMHKKGSFYDIVTVDGCRLVDDDYSAILRETLCYFEEKKTPFYHRYTHEGYLRHLLVRTGFASGQVMVVLVTASPIFPARSRFVSLLRERHPEITTIVMNCNPRKTSMVLGEQERILYGKGYIEDILCEKRFAISPRSFYQVNPQQTEVLYQRAIGMAQLKKGQRVLDAYCGIGTIGLIAADKVDEVIGVEVNAQAVKDANANAKRNGVENIRFVCADAGAFMTNLADAGEKIDVVFMDPPRSGSDEAFLQSVCRLSPDQVVYISCDPQTQKRDLAVLRAGGYHVREIQQVDMFPQTAHVETVVLMSRVEGK